MRRCPFHERPVLSHEQVPRSRGTLAFLYARTGHIYDCRESAMLGCRAACWFIRPGGYLAAFSSIDQYWSRVFGVPQAAGMSAGSACTPTIVLSALPCSHRLSGKAR